MNAVIELRRAPLPFAGGGAELEVVAGGGDGDAGGGGGAEGTREDACAEETLFPKNKKGEW